MGFLSKNTGLGCHVLLPGILLTQESNLCLLHCRQILCHWATREVMAFYIIPQIDWRNYLYLNSQKINFKFSAFFLEQTMKTKSEIGITDVHSLCYVQSSSVDKRLVPGALPFHVSPGSPAPGNWLPSQCGLPPSGCDFMDDFWWIGKKQTSWSSHLLLGCGNVKTKERMERKRRRGEGRK